MGGVTWVVKILCAELLSSIMKTSQSSEQDSEAAGFRELPLNL